MARILIGNVKHPLVNNGLTTEVGKYALDAAYGKALTDKDKELENAITQLNSDQIPAIVQDGIVFSDGVTVHHNDFVKIGKLCLIWWNIYFTKDFHGGDTIANIYYRSSTWRLVPFPLSNDITKRAYIEVNSNEIKIEGDINANTASSGMAAYITS